VPLLRRRAAFSGTERFHLYDALDDAGGVVEDVYAFSNGAGVDRNLVLVHHRHAETTVRIDHAIAAAPVGGGSSRTSIRLADAIELTGADDTVIRLHDPRFGWEARRTVGELRREGLRVTLGPYEARVLSVEVEPPALASPATTPEASAIAGSLPPPPRRVGRAKRQATPPRKRAATTAPGRRPATRRTPPKPSSR
jgi:hypothetical protein